jgi:hypothetical protein
MTHPTLDHEERLRRALRAAADSVEPAADGLGRIRARLTPPRPVIAAWMVSGTEPAVLRLRLAVTWLRLRLGLAHGRIGPVAGRARPALGLLTAAFTAIMPVRGEPRTRPTWLRTVGAMAAFVVIIGSGALAIGRLQQTVAPAGSVAAVGPSRGHASGRRTAGLTGAGTARELKKTGWPLAALAGPQLSTGLPPAPNPRKASPAPSSTCPPSTKPSSTPTPTPTSPSPSVSPTPTPTSPSPSVSPSPTVTPTASVSPTSGASAVPTSSAVPSGASVNTVADVGDPVSRSTVSPTPGRNKPACAPTG